VKFWNELCSNSGFTLGSGHLSRASPRIRSNSGQVGQNRIILLQNATWGPAGRSRLYVRDSYTTIIGEIDRLSKSHVLLRGTPGIGKSMFMYYYIYYLAKLNPSNLCIQVCYYVKSGQPSQEFFLNRIGGVVSVTTVLPSGRSLPDYYFSDSVDITKTDTSTKLTMLFSSIDEDHFSEFLKVKSSLRGSWDLHMPLVSFDELTEMADPDAQISDETLTFRNSVFGGSARNCLDEGNYEPPNKEIKNIIETWLNIFFKDMKDGNPTKANIQWTVSMLGSHFTGLVDGSKKLSYLKRSVFTHTYVNNMFGEPTTCFCSTFMKYICGRVVEGRDSDLRSRLDELFGASARGIAFEGIAFDQIYRHLQKGGKLDVFNIQSTISGKRKRRSSKETLTVKVKRKVWIRTVNDVKNLEDGDVGVPMFKNFPLVDFVLKPDIFLQMTVSATHQGAVGRLPDLRTALGGTKKNHKMIFVTEHKNVSQFSHVHDLQAINQYVMEPPS